MKRNTEALLSSAGSSSSIALNIAAVEGGLVEEVRKVLEAYRITEEKYNQLLARRKIDKKTRGIIEASKGKNLAREALKEFIPKLGEEFDSSYHRVAYTHALACGELFIQILIIIGEGESKMVVAMFNNMGNVYIDQGRYEKALEVLNRALMIQEKTFLGRESTDVAVTLHNIGNVYTQQCNHEKALEFLNRALVIEGKILGWESKGVADTLNNIGGIYLQQGNYEKALEVLNRVLAVEEKILGHESQDVAGVFNNIGAIYSQQGNYEKALEFLNQALAIQEKILGHDSPDVAETLANIGSVYYRCQCNYEKALEFFNQALAVREKILGHDSIDAAKVLNNIGNVYTEQDNYEKALEVLTQALAIREKILGPEHIDVADTLYNIGSIYEKQGEYEKALTSLNLALGIFKKTLVLKDYRRAYIQLFVARFIYQHTNQLPNQSGSVAQAIFLFKELLQIDHEILEECRSKKEILPSDLVQHNKLLYHFALAYSSANHVELAGKLYFDEALRFCSFKNFSALRLYYIAEALRFYSRAINSASEIAELYWMRAEIQFAEGQNILAARSVQKAITIAGNLNPKYQTLLAQCETKSKEFFARLDEDLMLQLETIINCYQEIQQHYLFDLQQNFSLSEPTKNMTAELIIKIRNLLDQGFGRVMHEVFAVPAKTDIYYPFYGSELALEKRLIEEYKLNLYRGQFVLSSNQASKNHPLALEVPRPHMLDFIAEFQAKGYLDSAGKYTGKIFPTDLRLNIFEINYDPYLEKVRENLTCNCGVEINAKFLGKNRVLDPLPLPEGKAIELYLKQEGVIEFKNDVEDAIGDPGVVQSGYYLFQEKYRKDPGLFDALWDGLEKQFPGYGRIILAKLKTMVAKPGLKDDYSEFHQAIIQSQAFYYYGKGRAPGAYKNTWLDRVVAISNDSKHVRLTPQGIFHELDTQTGLIEQRGLAVNIEYYESRFYGWSFVELLAQYGNSAWSDLERITHSRELLHVFRVHKIIDLQVVADTDILDYIKAIKEKKPDDEQKRLKEKCRNKIHAILAAELQPYVDTILDLLVRRALQRKYFILEPDVYVDAPQLLNQALTETRKLLFIFGDTLVKFRRLNSQAAIVPAVPQLQLGMNALLAIKHYRDSLHELEIFLQDKWRILQERHEKLCASTGRVALADLTVYHSTVKEIAKTCRRFPEERMKLVRYYEEAGNRLRACDVWLAIYYYTKAMREYIGYGRQDTPELVRISRILGDIYVAEKILPQAQSYFALIYELSHNDDDKKRSEELKKECANTAAIIDDDIYSQWLRSRKLLSGLYYLTFKLTLGLDDHNLLQQIGMRVAELVTKIRHILDQSYSRFIKVCIYRPNGIEEADIHYPNTGSKERLQRTWNEDQLLEAASGRASLEQYPTVKASIESSQPYAFLRPEESWLEKIIELSNQTKHMKVEEVAAAEVKDRMGRGMNVEELLPITYAKDNLSPAVYLPILKILTIALNSSYEIINELFQAIPLELRERLKSKNTAAVSGFFAARKQHEPQGFSDVQHRLNVIP